MLIHYDVVLVGTCLVYGKCRILIVFSSSADSNSNKYRIQLCEQITGEGVLMIFRMWVGSYRL
jgi:hypothetical protein